MGVVDSPLGDLDRADLYRGALINPTTPFARAHRRLDVALDARDRDDIDSGVGSGVQRSVRGALNLGAETVLQVLEIQIEPIAFPLTDSDRDRRSWANIIAFWSPHITSTISLSK